MKKEITKVPVRYIPPNLTKKDREKQGKMLKKSRSMYKKGVYYTRKKIDSFRSKKSNHIKNAMKIYGVTSIRPSEELVKATGCSLESLEKIVEKGEGAYFSSGSRPNQSAQSWGIARLASSITSGKSAAVDFDILEKGCHHRKKAFLLAKKSRKKYGYGHTKTRKTFM